MYKRQFLGYENVGLENLEEAVLNEDLVGDIDVDDSDDFKPLLWFKKTKPTMKPIKTPHPRRFKTTTSAIVPLNVPLPRPKTHSSGPLIILPLSDDSTKSRAKRKQSTPKYAKTTLKQPRNQPLNQPENGKPRNRCPNRLQTLMNQRKGKFRKA